MCYPLVRQIVGRLNEFHFVAVIADLDCFRLGRVDLVGDQVVVDEGFAVLFDLGDIQSTFNGDWLSFGELGLNLTRYWRFGVAEDDDVNEHRFTIRFVMSQVESCAFTFLGLAGGDFPANVSAKDGLVEIHVNSFSHNFFAPVISHWGSSLIIVKLKIVLLRLPGLYPERLHQEDVFREAGLDAYFICPGESPLNGKRGLRGPLSLVLTLSLSSSYDDEERTLSAGLCGDR